MTNYITHNNPFIDPKLYSIWSSKFKSNHFPINQSYFTTKNNSICRYELDTQCWSLTFNIFLSIKNIPSSNHHKVVTTIKLTIFKSFVWVNWTIYISSFIKPNSKPIYRFIWREDPSYTPRTDPKCLLSLLQ